MSGAPGKYSIYDDHLYKWLIPERCGVDAGLGLEFNTRKPFEAVNSSDCVVVVTVVVVVGEVMVVVVVGFLVVVANGAAKK